MINGHDHYINFFFFFKYNKAKNQKRLTMSHVPDRKIYPQIIQEEKVMYCSSFSTDLETTLNQSEIKLH